MVMMSLDFLTDDVRMCVVMLTLDLLTHDVRMGVVTMSVLKCNWLMVLTVDS